MLRPIVNTFSGVTLCILALAAGCGDNNPGPASNPDLATATVDLAVPSPDLATPPDLASPAIAVPAGCNTNTVVTGTVAYTTLTGNGGARCMGPTCHNNGTAPVFNSRLTFTNVMINKQSSSSFQYVVPNMADKSYLLYKLRNTHLSVPGGSGGQMPLGGTALNDTEFCTMYNWVSHGAPVN